MHGFEIMNQEARLKTLMVEPTWTVWGTEGGGDNKTGGGRGVPLNKGGLKSNDATLQSYKIRKSDKCKNVANKCIKWSIVV